MILESAGCANCGRGNGEFTATVGTPKIRGVVLPRWSPDGSAIAFLTEQPDFNEIWLIRPDGTGLRQLTHLSHDAGDLAWSPDGTWLACSVNRNGSFDLALIDVQTGEPPSSARPGASTPARTGPPTGKPSPSKHQSPTQPPDLDPVWMWKRAPSPNLTFSVPRPRPPRARNPRTCVVQEFRRAGNPRVSLSPRQTQRCGGHPSTRRPLLTVRHGLGHPRPIFRRKRLHLARPKLSWQYGVRFQV